MSVWRTSVNTWPRAGGTGLGAAHVGGESAGSAGEGVEPGGAVGERVVVVGGRARRPGEISVDVGGGPPEVLTDPLDGVGQVAQLAGDAPAREWHIGIVVGAAVAGRQ